MGPEHWLSDEQLKNYADTFNNKWGWWRRWVSRNPNGGTFVSFGLGVIVALTLIRLF